jgi:hypothetical protein
MIWVTDSQNGNKVAIAKRHIIAVFTIPEGEQEGLTAITLTAGSIVVKESDTELVSLMIGS